MQDSCMQKNVQATLRLAETNNSQLTRPAVFSGVSVGSFPEQRLVIEVDSEIALNRKRSLIVRRAENRARPPKIQALT